jgi:hypothetical protein
MAGTKIIRFGMVPPSLDVQSIRFTAKLERIGRRLPVNLDTNGS